MLYGSTWNDINFLTPLDSKEKLCLDDKDISPFQIGKADFVSFGFRTGKRPSPEFVHFGHQILKAYHLSEQDTRFDPNNHRHQFENHQSDLHLNCYFNVDSFTQGFR